MTKEQELFISGMETSIKWIRKNMAGSALRMFDIHCYQVLDFIEQVKKMNK